MENAGIITYMNTNYSAFICTKPFVHSCNTGYSGPACLPTSVLRELREDFSEYPLSSTLWSSVTGNNGNLNSRCGRLTGKSDNNVINL